MEIKILVVILLMWTQWFIDYKDYVLYNKITEIELQEYKIQFEKEQERLDKMLGH